MFREEWPGEVELVCLQCGHRSYDVSPNGRQASAPVVGPHEGALAA
jgi:hypothetical protein